MYTVEDDEEMVIIDGVYYSKDKTILLDNDDESIKNVNIIDGVIEIEDFAFAGCKNLETIELPDSLETIDAFAFKGCVALKKVKLPDSLMELGHDAFKGCTSLTSLKIPKYVTNIAKSLVANCPNLEVLYIPSTITEFSKGCFLDSSFKEIRVYGGELSKGAKISLTSALKADRYLEKVSSDTYIKTKADGVDVKIIQNDVEP